MYYRSTPIQLVLFLISAAFSQTIPYSRSEETCLGQDKTLLNIFGKTNRTRVIVQPHCDDAINATCSSFLTEPRQTYASYVATAPNNTDPGACQTHLVGFGSANNIGLNYTSCVQGFQSITIDCMLLGVGKYAQRTRQAGVRGVYITTPAAGLPKPGEEGFSPKNVSITAPRDELAGVLNRFNLLMVDVRG
ncbi:MAG: hypothetical protein Q9213_001649 [Squamulea squamosa]